jgi:hypothetical protein
MLICKNCGHEWTGNRQAEGEKCKECWTGKGTYFDPSKAYSQPPADSQALQSAIMRISERSQRNGTEIEEIKQIIEGILKGSLKRAEFIAHLMGMGWSREEFISSQEESRLSNINPGAEFKEGKPREQGDPVAEFRREGKPPARIDTRYLCAVFLMGFYEGQDILDTREEILSAARKIPYMMLPRKHQGVRTFDEKYFPEILKDLFADQK